MKILVQCTSCQSQTSIHKSTWYAWRKRNQSTDYVCSGCKIRLSNRLREHTKPCTATQLANLYATNKLSQSQIGKKLGISQSRVAQLMGEFGIRNRDYVAAAKNMHRQRIIIFDHHQEQLILGSMLGDANLHRWTQISNKKSRNKLSGHKLTFAHSIKQIDYLIHKRSIIGGSKIGQRISGFGAIIKHFSFCNSASMGPYIRLCLDDDHQKRVSQEWLNRLDWCGIAYWYMDDGSLIITKKRPRIEFHTESFSTEERELLRAMLRERFDLETSLRKCNGDINQQKIVSKHKHQVTPFLEHLSAHIIPSMQYKIRWII